MVWGKGKVDDFHIPVEQITESLKVLPGVAKALLPTTCRPPRAGRPRKSNRITIPPLTTAHRPACAMPRPARPLGERHRVRRLLL